MGKYTDAALAAYAGREAAEEQERQADRDALVAAAKAAASPLWAGADGKPIIDPVKAVRADHIDVAHRLVILSVLDDKGVVEVSFAVYPDRPEMRVVRHVDGEWEGLTSPPVSDLDDVGAVLAGDA